MNPTPLSTLLIFPFKDPAWVKKLLILTLVLLLSAVIPILPWILVAGYLARLVRRMVVEKSEPILPEWDDLGGIFMDGWRPFAAMVTYLLPVFVIFLVVWMLMLLPAVIQPFVSAWSVGEYRDAIYSLLVVITSLAGVGGFAIFALISLTMAFILPVPLVNTIVHQDYEAAFRFREWLPILGANLSGFIVAFAVSVGMNLVFGFVVQVLFFTIVLCCLTPLLIIGSSTYFYLVYAALYGEAYRVGLEKISQGKPGGSGLPPEPAPASPPEKASEEPAAKPADESSAGKEET